MQLTERQLNALLGLFITKGKRKGQVRRTKPKYGTDAYIAHEAKVMALNPHRMPSQMIMLLDKDQMAFFWEMVKVFEASRDKAVSESFTKQLQEAMA